jgi:hypothetical protein
MALSLRGPDALAVLTHKNTLKTDLAESDCVAVVQAGARTFTVPIYIQKGSGKAVIESDFTFNEAMPNTFVSIDGGRALVVRFEKLPQIVAPPTPPSEPTPQDIFNERMREAREANPGVNELSLRLRVTEQLAKENLAERQRNRQEQQDLTVPDKWASFANAAKRARNTR